MDDVEINIMDINNMINIKNKYKIEIISPRVHGTGYEYMRSATDGLGLTNFLELFFFIMTPIDFAKFSSVNTYENKYMWGVDLIYGHININTAVYYKSLVIHKFQNSNNQSEKASICMKEYLTKLYKLTPDFIFMLYTPIKTYIEETQLI
jgi:hypothetical protein